MKHCLFNGFVQTTYSLYCLFNVLLAIYTYVTDAHPRCEYPIYKKCHRLALTKGIIIIEKLELCRF